MDPELVQHMWVLGFSPGSSSSLRDCLLNSPELCHRISVGVAPAQSQLKPEAELSLAEAQPEPPIDGSHISANSGSG